MNVINIMLQDDSEAGVSTDDEGCDSLHQENVFNKDICKVRKKIDGGREDYDIIKLEVLISIKGRLSIKCRS